MCLLPLPVFLPMHILMLSDMSGRCPVPCTMRNWNLVLYATQHQGALSLGTWDLCLFLCPIKRTNTWDLRALKN
ncbi:rCG32011 [Rattus norvegicus]|uniref:RCG32011 n=1 Tax=Rattus norvegicus TaxID=10116 RepID=A6KDS8_RAT|nr:rCG32011 [Rattus norvegicus]